ncbi:hypothetical protein [Stenotrophomonas sp. Iso1]|uniref:hypothetical protein n=1 Tax=Stenotrophomonas sp. Iso1 TaxID=2977283 RepID=UPI0022B76E16|nr:hypothetical protein [Stenotrophomonas sp. Iso1]
MDLMRLLRSLEEFLYELIGWLVFYPRTFWRILLHPGAIARYTRKELTGAPEQQFQETISPVLMLILSVGLAHAMEMAFRLPALKVDSPLGRVLFGTEESLLLTRSIIFCCYALGAALGTLIRERKPITRDTLREPFSVQAFLACPFVVLLSTGIQLLQMPSGEAQVPGAALSAIACVWYVLARVAAYRALHGGTFLPVFAATLVWFVGTSLVILAVVTASVL